MTGTILHICITCRAGSPAEIDPCAGQRLFGAAWRGLGRVDGVALAPSTCMANCERGCSAALSAPGKWSYLLGHLAPELADDLLVYAAAFALSANGTVMPSRRPATLRHVVLGRVPPAIVPTPSLPMPASAG